MDSSSYCSLHMVGTCQLWRTTTMSSCEGEHGERWENPSEIVSVFDGVLKGGGHRSHSPRLLSVG